MLKLSELHVHTLNIEMFGPPKTPALASPPYTPLAAGGDKQMFGSE